MHKQRTKFLTILSLLFLLIYLKPFNTAYAEGEVDRNNRPLLQFPVLSDIHIGGDLEKERFKRALNDMNSIAPNYNAMVLLGDMTSYGKEEQYDDFNRILNASGSKNSEKIMTIGNHEYFDGLYLPGYIPGKYQQRFIEKTNMPGLYYDKWVGGYHFIALGSEGFPDEDDDDHALISDEQYSWLENTLSQNADPAKPIFVFLHQAIDNTVYGSEEWGAGFTDDKLFNLLKQYPQVIFFSGHSHYILNHPRTINQNGFTMVNAGSVAYGWTDLGYTTTSQGLLVNVYSDRVEIKAREFTNNTDIQTFTVKTPYVQTYSDSERPFFKLGSSVKIDKNNSGETATLLFEAAIDNTAIDHYVIKQNDEIIYKSFTNFLKSSSPGMQSIELKNLTPNTKYDLVISAVDAWNNKSFNTLKVSFTTSELNGWKKVDGKWIFNENGKKVVGWKRIDGKWYIFDQQGWMLTGWYTDGTNKYYLDDTGVMQIGFKEIDGKTYYFGPDGDLKKGWVKDQNKWYFLDNEGISKQGWVLDAKQWYYIKYDGMATGWMQERNVWYYLNSSGAMQTGWIYTGGQWYFLNNSGGMQTGWNYLGDKWYFLNNSGAMQTGWNYLDNKWYFMASSGEMKTGWILEKKKWYFLNQSGAMVTGWSNIGGKWYYFYPDGSMA